MKTIEELRADLLSEFDAIVSATAKQVILPTKKGTEAVSKNPAINLSDLTLRQVYIDAGYVSEKVDPAVIAAQEAAYDKAVGILKSGLIKKSRGDGDPSKRKNFANLCDSENTVESLTRDALMGGDDAKMSPDDFKIIADEDAKEVAVRVRKNGIWQQKEVTGTYPTSVAYNAKVLAGLLPEPKKPAKKVADVQTAS